MTAQDLITSALRLIGVLASGESLPANEATDGLNSLNDMLDSWSTQNLLIPNKTREVFPLVSGQQSYTMGPSGNFNTTRPMWVEEALIQQGSGTSTLEIKMHLYTKEQYADLVLKQTQSTIPLYLYSDGAYPLTTLNVWPVPNAVNNIVLYSAKPLSSLSSISTAISLPPGYQRALRYNLALELSPEYGRQVPEIVAVSASNSKAEIKRVNSEPRYLRADYAVSAKSSSWNWYTGESS